ncbi:MAG: 4Fe-4S dicluster domain-containing protein [Candidatus Bathyarchaeota archaeon]|nr:4Fe-4S dicluster domain-containing protein [Candidatus Bathyarchaeota archaeon]
MEYKRMEKRTSLAFSNMVKSRLGGKTITSCYQCGTCASSCPVAKITDKFNPREIIKLSLLGEREEVLSGDSIWLCCSCYNCQERCPQKVEIADVIYALRNMAFEKGHIPNLYSEFASAIINDGRIAKISKFMEQKRPAIGLPPLQPTGVDALRKILSATGFDKLQKEKEEAS